MKLCLGRILINEKHINSDLLKNHNQSFIEIVTELPTDELPVQIIGWDTASELFDEASILNKHIKNNIYWTFSPMEKLQQFNEDVNGYLYNLYEDFINQYEYKFIDPIINKINSFNDIKVYFSNSLIESTYITDEFMYCISGNTIYGIDLTYYKLLGYNIELLKNNILDISVIKLIEDYTTDGVFHTYKELLNREIDKKFIPALETQKC